MALERVYAVWDYWDGIRSGFADFRGTPHYFERPWDGSIEDYSETFELTPVSRDIIELVTEQMEIFRSWADAFHRGQTTAATHPGRPGQNERYAHLERAILAVVRSNNLVACRMVGKFETLSGQEDLPPGMFQDVGVEWSHHPSLP